MQDKQIQIVVWNKKGGVGKTAISDEITASLIRTGIKAARICMDTQQGSIYDGVAPAADADVYVIDTPGQLNIKNQVKWLSDADVVVIPTKAGGLEEDDAFMTSLETCHNLGKKIVVAANFLRPNRKISKDLVEFLDEIPIKIERAYIYDMEDMALASRERKSIVEYTSDRKKANSVIDAVNVIRQSAGLEPEERLKPFERRRNRAGH